MLKSASNFFLLFVQPRYTAPLAQKLKQLCTNSLSPTTTSCLLSTPPVALRGTSEDGVGLRRRSDAGVWSLSG